MVCVLERFQINIRRPSGSGRASILAAIVILYVTSARVVAYVIWGIDSRVEEHCTAKHLHMTRRRIGRGMRTRVTLSLLKRSSAPSSILHLSSKKFSSRPSSVKPRFSVPVRGRETPIAPFSPGKIHMKGGSSKGTAISPSTTRDLFEARKPQQVRFGHWRQTQKS